MKINVTHRYLIKNIKNDWIYFGSSFVNQQNLERKVSGKRIEILNEVKKEFIKKKKLFIKLARIFKEYQQR